MSVKTIYLELSLAVITKKWLKPSVDEWYDITLIPNLKTSESIGKVYFPEKPLFCLSFWLIIYFLVLL